VRDDGSKRGDLDHRRREQKENSELGGKESNVEERIFFIKIDGDSRKAEKLCKVGAVKRQECGRPGEEKKVPTRVKMGRGKTSSAPSAR